MKLKKLFLSLAIAVLLAIPMWIMQPAEAQASWYRFNLTASWNANAEPDMGGYYLWGARPDATSDFYAYDPTLGVTSPWVPTIGVLGTGSLIVKTLTTVSLVSLPIDSGVFATGNLPFKIQALDVNGNVSALSTVFNLAYSIDVTPPSVPTGLNVIKGNQIKIP
jgi:hypothetical protein